MVADGVSVLGILLGYYLDFLRQLSVATESIARTPSHPAGSSTEQALEFKVMPNSQQACRVAIVWRGPVGSVILATISSARGMCTLPMAPVKG